MASNRKAKRMQLHDRDGYTVLDLGEMEIWDGADLALLRETLTRLIEVEKRRAIGVSMRFVKYIPSGFFGMLYDWHEKRNVAFALYHPQPNVERMLWFRQFFAHEADGAHRLLTEPKRSLAATCEALWPTATVNGREDAKHSFLVGTRADG